MTQSDDIDDTTEGKEPSAAEQWDDRWWATPQEIAERGTRIEFGGQRPGGVL